MMLTEPRLPWTLKSVNAVGGMLDGAGLSPVSLAPEPLMATAKWQTGLSDFGEADFKPGLDRLCQSLIEDAALTLVGRLSLRDLLLRSLVTRLRRMELRKWQPEAFAASLRSPLIVVGLPRSGTTFLHRLLALGDDTRHLKTYELQQPIPGDGPDWRRAELAARLHVLKHAAPAIDAKHFLGVDEPEECMLLLNDTFLSLTFWTLAPCYGYVEWLLDQDRYGAYRVYREHLQLIQARSPDQRLVLKAPAHTPFLAELVAAVPEAKLVQIHRDPVACLASVCSLLHTFHTVVTRQPNPLRFGHTNQRLIEHLLASNAAGRTKIGDDRVLDVRYDDFVADPVATVRRIHEHHVLGFSEALRGRLEAFVERRPRHQHGKHEYRAEDFGLVPEVVRERTRAYRTRYLAE